MKSLITMKLMPKPRVTAKFEEWCQKVPNWNFYSQLPLKCQVWLICQLATVPMDRTIHWWTNTWGLPHVSCTFRGVFLERGIWTAWWTVSGAASLCRAGPAPHSRSCFSTSPTTTQTCVACSPTASPAATIHQHNIHLWLGNFLLPDGYPGNIIIIIVIIIIIIIIINEKI